MADTHGDVKQHIKENFTVQGPADAHQRLYGSVPYVEGNEKEAFCQKDRISLALQKHFREKKQEQKGSQSHKIIKGKNADQPLSQEKFRFFVGGMHDHETADTEKDIHAESAAAEKADMLQHDKKRGDAP